MIKPLMSLLAAGLLGGCAIQPDTPSPLTGREWIVDTIDDRKALDGSLLSLTFSADGRVSGSAGCNRFFAQFQLMNHNTIRIRQAASTMMACPEALMQQERRFLDLLEHLNRFRIDPQGNLILTGEQHSILAH